MDKDLLKSEAAKAADDSVNEGAEAKSKAAREYEAMAAAQDAAAEALIEAARKKKKDSIAAGENIFEKSAGIGTPKDWSKEGAGLRERLEETRKQRAESRAAAKEARIEARAAAKEAKLEAAVKAAEEKAAAKEARLEAAAKAAEEKAAEKAAKAAAKAQAREARDNAKLAKQLKAVEEAEAKAAAGAAGASEGAAKTEAAGADEGAASKGEAKGAEAESGASKAEAKDAAKGASEKTVGGSLWTSVPAEESSKPKLSKKKRIAIGVTAGAAAALLIGYFAGAAFYKNRFFANTSYAGVDISSKTKEEAQALLAAAAAGGYEIQIVGKYGENEIIHGSDINVSYDAGNSLDELLKAQEGKSWIAAIFSKNDAGGGTEASVDYDSVMDAVTQLECTDAAKQQLPTDASIDASSGTAVIVPDSEGTLVDAEKARVGGRGRREERLHADRP